ncbi:MAG: hypothetical protein VX405_10055 [Myxococcota bacterium]|nr:hypothetical protein [Myxococcales bacterium]MEC7751835.1 hypothetical protein [Myxococcota bacterium]
MRLQKILVLFTFVAGTAGCAATQPKKAPTPVQEAVEEEPPEEKIVLPDGVEGMDINGDNKPDVFKHYKEVEGEQVIVKRETDLNADGTIDVTRHYSLAQKPIKEIIDLDFDGKIDVTRHYQEGVLLREEFDLNYDEKIDMTKFYEDGKLIRKEQDAKLDGSVDYWEYYDEKEVLERIGVDHDGDGEIDDWHLGKDKSKIADPESGGALSKEGPPPADDLDKGEGTEAADSP